MSTEPNIIWTEELRDEWQSIDGPRRFGAVAACRLALVVDLPPMVVTTLKNIPDAIYINELFGIAVCDRSETTHPKLIEFLDDTDEQLLPICFIGRSGHVWFRQSRGSGQVFAGPHKNQRAAEVWQECFGALVFEMAVHKLQQLGVDPVTHGVLVIERKGMSEKAINAYRVLTHPVPVPDGFWCMAEHRFAIAVALPRDALKAEFSCVARAPADAVAAVFQYDGGDDDCKCLCFWMGRDIKVFNREIARWN